LNFFAPDALVALTAGGMHWALVAARTAPVCSQYIDERGMDPDIYESL
jgi:hypothetical protein